MTEETIFKTMLYEANHFCNADIQYSSQFLLDGTTEICLIVALEKVIYFRFDELGHLIDVY